MHFSLLFVAWLLACAGFAVVYVAARRLDNYGIVDVAWAAGFIPLALLYSGFGDAPWGRRVVLLALGALWSGRLAMHLGRRVWRHHPQEDGRYQQLRRDWGPALPRKMVLFFQAQALVLVAFSWPWLLVCSNPAARVSGWESAGAAIVLLAVVGEAMADAQLDAFKADPANRGLICARGLWQYSRHPNYFFEWLVWVGFAAMALPARWGWTALLCPLIMLYLLLRVTGIRYTEQQLERSKGTAYREYRARTSAFVPWFPRSKRTPSAL